METINISLNICEGTFFQSIDAIVLQVKLPQRRGILESSGGDVADVVVIQVEKDEPLEVVKDSIIHNANIVEAEINGL